MKYKLGVLFILVWLVLSVNRVGAAGTVHYLDCNGSDSNSGTAVTSAWQSLGKAGSFNYLAGDQLLLKRGCVWTGSLTFTESGTQAANIYVGTYGTGEMPIVEVKTDNTAGIDIYGSYITVDGVGVRAVATSVEAGCQNNPKGHMIGVDLRAGASYDTIKNSSITGGYTGVFIRSGAHHNKIIENSFINNTMMSPLDTAADNDAGAFGVLLWGDDNEIGKNLFSGQNACSYDYVRDGSAVEIYGGQRNLIHHNKASNSDSFSELGNSRSSDNTYAYNLYYSTLDRSIFLVTRGASSGYGPVTNTKVLNNTVYLTGAQSQGFVCHAGCNTGILTLKNNIIRAGLKSGYADGLFDNSNNIFYGGPAQFSLGPGDVVADPQFINPGTFDFHLKSTSPAINKATTDTLALGIATDLDGNPVPVNGVVDIGVYEYGSLVNPPTSTPIPFPTAVPVVVVGDGDVNGDGTVDFKDVVSISGKWLAMLTDSNDQYRDGKINSLDLAVVMQKIGMVLPTAIPTATIRPTQTPTLVPTAVPTASPTGAPSVTPKPTTAATPTVPIPTATPIPSGSVITVAVTGDINPSGNTSVTSASGKNAASIIAANPNIFINVGDWQYSYGTCTAFLSGYDRLWGSLNSKTYGTAGPTHDWDATNSNGQQYQQYLSGTCPGQTSKPVAGEFDPRNPYSFNIGKWHFVQLSSGCWRYSTTCSGSGETSWLATDLANAVSTGHPYIVAFWHEPYWSSSTSTHPSPTTAEKPWIDLLYQYRAKMIFNGHQHGYERFLPQNNSGISDVNGIQEIIVGTGGIGFYPWSNKVTNSAVQQTGTYGWVKLTLRDDGSYDWQFVPTSGGTFTDSGTRPATSP